MEWSWTKPVREAASVTSTRTGEMGLLKLELSWLLDKPQMLTRTSGFDDFSCWILDSLFLDQLIFAIPQFIYYEIGMFTQ